MDEQNKSVRRAAAEHPNGCCWLWGGACSSPPRTPGEAAHAMTTFAVGKPAGPWLCECFCCSGQLRNLSGFGRPRWAGEQAGLVSHHRMTRGRTPGTEAPGRLVLPCLFRNLTTTMKRATVFKMTILRLLHLYFSLLNRQWMRNTDTYIFEIFSKRISLVEGQRWWEALAG